MSAVILFNAPLMGISYLETLKKVNPCTTGSLTEISSFDTCYVFGKTP